MRVDWVLDATAQQVKDKAQEVIESYPTLPVKQASIQVDGRSGVMLSPVPGIKPGTLIYVPANDRLYEILYNSEKLLSSSEKLDDQGQTLLKNLHFQAPSQSLESLGLLNEDDVLRVYPPFDTPPPEVVPTEANFARIPSAELQQRMLTVQPGCTQLPTSLYIRVPWDSSANGPGTDFSSGWSKAGPYYYGEGDTHKRCNDPGWLESYYALDHPLKE